MSGIVRSAGEKGIILVDKSEGGLGTSYKKTHRIEPLERLLLLCTTESPAPLEEAH
jgi:hypothetical protein